jgi:3-oxoacyl-[acyl-carrier protein] reductase
MQKHSLIIGGTRGIGRELAKIFSGEGQLVSIIGKRPLSAEDATMAGVQAWTVDLVDEKAVESALDEITERRGKLNSLVFLQRFKGEGDKWIGEVETSLSATKKVIEAVAGKFSDAGDNSIVVVSSIADQFIAEGQPVGYHVAKAGLFQMVCYYAVTLGAKGIRVNCVSPGTVVKQENREFYTKSDKLQELFKKTIPLARMGTAVESANVIAFLCSPKASFVTGQKIVVDGGVSLLSQESLARKLAGI